MSSSVIVNLNKAFKYGFWCYIIRTSIDMGTLRHWKIAGLSEVPYICYTCIADVRLFVSLFVCLFVSFFSHTLFVSLFAAFVCMFVEVACQFMKLIFLHSLRQFFVYLLFFLDMLDFLFVNFFVFKKICCNLLHFFAVCVCVSCFQKH